MVGVVRILDLGREAPRRRSMDGGRRDLAQRLVRPLVVVLAPERIEAALLRRHRRAGWERGLLLEGEMKPLVAAVLLRLAHVDVLGPDAELDQPGAQLAQWPGAHRAERRSVVAAEVLGQAVGPEGPLEGALDGYERRMGQGAAAQRRPTESVCHRQRVTPGPVADAEVALEVHRPNHVRGGRMRERRGPGRQPPALTPGPDQAFALEQLADRARGGEIPLRLVRSEPGRELARSPRRMLAAERHQPRRHLVRHSPGVRVRAPRAIHQRRPPSFVAAGKPLIARLARDPEEGAELRHGQRACAHLADEEGTLVHEIHRGPRHRASVPPLLPMSPVYLSPMYPVWTHPSPSAKPIGPPPRFAAVPRPHAGITTTGPRLAVIKRSDADPEPRGSGPARAPRRRRRQGHRARPLPRRPRRARRLARRDRAVDRRPRRARGPRPRPGVRLAPGGRGHRRRTSPARTSSR